MIIALIKYMRPCVLNNEETIIYFENMPENEHIEFIYVGF